MSLSQQHFDAAIRLQHYLESAHWHDDRGLLGPDPGIRLNYRVGRFLKSYTRWLPFRDAMYYTQGQAYWSLANWKLQAITGEPRFARIAERCCDLLIAHQRPQGYWEYPNPEWKNRIATTEGNWAALALLETYRRTEEPRFLDAARNWHEYLDEVTGYQKQDGTWAVNYFAHLVGARVCNNSVTTLRLLTDLAATARDELVARPYPFLLEFLKQHQRETGEFPYTVEGIERGDGRPHFQCFQYNAFACINLIETYRINLDASLLPMIRRLAEFLATGQQADGRASYACHDRHRTVIYHAAALATALQGASELRLGDYAEASARGLDFVLKRQRDDGGLPYSVREHRLLADRRSYPRYQAMILLHLLRCSHPDVDITGPRSVASQPARVAD